MTIIKGVFYCDMRFFLTLFRDFFYGLIVNERFLLPEVLEPVQYRYSTSEPNLERVVANFRPNNICFMNTNSTVNATKNINNLYLVVSFAAFFVIKFEQGHTKTFLIP